MALAAATPKIEASPLRTTAGLDAGAAAMASTTALAQRGRARTPLQLAPQPREQHVLDQDLSQHAGQLLARADRAVTAVLRSRVHLGDQLDRQRNNLLLPAQRWEVAQLLRTHNRLERSLPEQAQGDQVRPVLEAHRAVLDQALQGIERRVAALETYAEQAAEADRRYAELTQLDQVSAAGPELLELMARSVRDDLAVAEVADLTARTTAVTDAFTPATRGSAPTATGPGPPRPGEPRRHRGRAGGSPQAAPARPAPHDVPLPASTPRRPPTER
ncbi:hypothetical protein [Streptacidiphilus sp. EB103A]|uniref:hypothetical protein n=1 Tax=Streptacidiphilus sp. EB103A TaxID=3156275 RepID=UPI0035164085